MGNIRYWKGINLFILYNILKLRKLSFHIIDYQATKKNWETHHAHSVLQQL